LNGYLSVSAFTDKFWRGLCQALSLDHLISDERFVTEQDRFRHQHDLRPFLEEAFSGDTTEAWLTILERLDVPCGPVHDYDELFADPQVRHNGLVKKLFHPSLETTRIVGNPLHFNETPASEKRSAPILGEDTDEILRHFGYAAEEIRHLRANRIL
jgi:crotonobetainyl-CoA:carnitine CoA-transferase CaiB-like acyl-CoA transferase